MGSSVISDVSTEHLQLNWNHDGDVSLHPLRSIHIIHLKSLSSVRSHGQIGAGAPAAVCKQRSCRVNGGKSCSWNYWIICEEKACAEMSDWAEIDVLKTIYSGEVCWLLRWYHRFPGWKRARLTVPELQDEI